MLCVKLVEHLHSALSLVHISVCSHIAVYVMCYNVKGLLLFFA